ncbi:response regulator [candidate division KSB1 bacterium]|nr:response regulator [candidate division KSB1 bacterium]
MSEQLILVADGDPKNLQILKEHLGEANFQVATVNTGLQAWEYIKKSRPTLVLSEVTLPGLDGLQLLEKMQKDPETAPIPLIFLTNRRELQDRVRSLKMGAKDYLVKPLHVKEVIAHIKMVLARLARRQADDSQSFFKLNGRLEELSVIELIESFGVERKTGILTVTSQQGKSGQIYFKDGCVINAKQDKFQKEKAIFEMLNWANGTFNMVFKEVNVPDEIAVSNLGLLLEGLKRLEQREKLTKQIPNLDTTFLPTATFMKLISQRNLSAEYVKLIALFDGKHRVEEILNLSPFDDLKTLEVIVQLNKQQLIKTAGWDEKVVSTPLAGAGELAISDSDITPQKIETPKPRPKVKIEVPRREAAEGPYFPRIEPGNSRILRNPSVENIPEKKMTESKPAVEMESRERPLEVPESREEVPEIQTAKSRESNGTSGRENADLRHSNILKPKSEEVESEPEKPSEIPVAHEEISPPIEPAAKHPAISKPEKETIEAIQQTDGRFKTPELSQEILQSVIFRKKPTIPKPPAPRVDPEIKSGLFILIEGGEFPIFKSVTQNQFQSRNFNGAGIGELKVGRLELSETYYLNLISVSMDGKFNLVLDSYAEKMTGFTLVIDCSKTNNWEYLGYLVRMLHERYAVNFFLIGLYLENSDVKTKDVLRDRLSLGDRIPIFGCETLSPNSIRKIFIQNIHDWPNQSAILRPGSVFEQIET